MEDYNELIEPSRPRFANQTRDLIRDSICTTTDGTYTLQEKAQYDPRVLKFRDKQLTEMFNEAITESDLEEIPDTERLQSRLLRLPLGFPLPDAAYLNGDGKWCVDWESQDSEKAVYTCLASRDLLLVIVDTADGKYLRLPSDLSSIDPLKHLRYGLTQIFEDE